MKWPKNHEIKIKLLKCGRKYKIVPPFKCWKQKTYKQLKKLKITKNIENLVLVRTLVLLLKSLHSIGDRGLLRHCVVDPVADTVFCNFFIFLTTYGQDFANIFFQDFFIFLTTCGGGTGPGGSFLGDNSGTHIQLYNM